MRHIADAEQPFRTAIEINPSGFGYHYALGYVLLKQGRLREAREQFQAELANDPDSPAKRDIAFIDTRLSGH
jgi:tetratricopeptide (TPR) repeat protein